jgi:DNA polymerase III delta prime subunit
MENNIPFVEKYRPKTLDGIVLNTNNRILFNNILDEEIFPNILLYGPPGTGKTTTIIALINEYNERRNNKNYETMHLNASDDRGIDNIRNIILNFVSTMSLFQNKHKFVILDEVDYMTEQAQLGLKILIESKIPNVSFCLICNYITKLDVSLSNNFIKLQFKNIDNDKLFILIKKIIQNENIVCDNKTIKKILKMWEHDIRSMINYIQANNTILNNIKILQKDDYEKILDNVKNKTLDKNKMFFKKLSQTYKISIKEIIYHLIYYLMDIDMNDKELFYICKLIIHNKIIDDDYLFNLFIIKIKSIL